METNDIENEIVEKIQSQNLSNISDDQLGRIVSEEIKKANYLKEDWQIHYAEERILKELKPSEDICPFCGSESKKYRPNQFLFFPIAFLIPKYRCLKCKKFFPPIFKNPTVNFIFEWGIKLIIIWFIFNLLRVIFVLFKNF